MEADHRTKASAESHRRKEAGLYQPDFWLARAFGNVIANWTYLVSFGSTVPCKPKRLRGSDMDATAHDMHVVLGDFALACRQNMQGQGYPLGESDLERAGVQR